MEGQRRRHDIAVLWEQVGSSIPAYTTLLSESLHRSVKGIAILLSFADLLLLPDLFRVPRAVCS